MSNPVDWSLVSSSAARDPRYKPPGPNPAFLSDRFAMAAIGLPSVPERRMRPRRHEPFDRLDPFDKLRAGRLTRARLGHSHQAKRVE